MPIQWSGLITSPYQLASVIQGESSTASGQFGVASVMFNRLQNGGFGNSIQDVVTPGNFNGYNSGPSAYAQQLANDLWNGNAPSGGNTGNALYFAAPSSSNAAWANPNTASGQGLFGYGGNNLGGNYYSDTMGPPSSNFVAPSYGSASDTMTNGDYLTMNPSDPNYGDITGYSVAGVNAPLDGSTPLGQGGIGSDAVAGGTAGAMGQSGTPLPGQQNTGEASVAGQDVQKGLGQAGTDVQQASAGITGTLASAINSLEDYTNSAFVIAALVVVGLILVAYGLGMFKHAQIPIHV